MFKRALNRALTLSLAAVLSTGLAYATPGGDGTPDDPPAEETTSRGAPDRKLSKKERKERYRLLPQKYIDWLASVEPIIIQDEVDVFLILDSDAQRDYYIEAFWAIRDHDRIRRDESYREDYELRVEEARARFGNLTNDRSRIYLLRGRPDEILDILACDRYIQPSQVWYYASIEGISQTDSLLLFFRPRLGGRDYRLWEPLGNRTIIDLLSVDGERLGINQALSRAGFECRNGEALLAALSWTAQHEFVMAKLFQPPEVDAESSERAIDRMVISNPEAAQLKASMDATFPGRRGTRTIVSMYVEVSSEGVGSVELNGFEYYNVDVIGELLKDERVYEAFRYRFDYEKSTAGETLPVVVERYLRPGDYVLRIKVLDVNSGAEAVIENPLVVPLVEAEAVLTEAQKIAGSKLERLREAFVDGRGQLKIAPLADKVLTGLQKIETIITGSSIEAVEFYLDGAKVMTKNDPPYELEIDLGMVPSRRYVKAVGLDADGKLVSGDEIPLNVGADPFRVHIVSPRVVGELTGRARVEVSARVPTREKLARIELFVNDVRVASLFTPPFVQPVDIPVHEPIVYLRAVAFLEGEEELTAEDVVFLKKPEFLEEVDVHLVELPTTVLKDRKPVRGLEEGSFEVFDSGEPVEIAKFEYVSDLPLSIGIAIDTSGSMKDRIVAVQHAAAEFLGSVMKKGDRGFLVGFDRAPYLIQNWTHDLADLSRGLGTLRAREATSLYDAFVFSLYHFPGVKGQKALIVLTDGEDTASEFKPEQAREYSRRSGIPIYVIAVGVANFDFETRGRMKEFAEESGGGVYFVEGADDLAGIYGEIERELRSQYLLGIYPPDGVKPGSRWRSVRVEVDGARVKTLSGYYP